MDSNPPPWLEALDVEAKIAAEAELDANGFSLVPINSFLKSKCLHLSHEQLVIAKARYAPFFKP